MKKIITIISLIFIISCISNNCNVYSQNAISKQKNEKVNFEIKKFTNLPNEIDGCACYFYLSKQDESKGKYIFVNDFANVAFIFINKKLEKFKLTKSTNHNTIYYYSNNTYDVIIRILKNNNSNNEVEEEDSDMTGTMDVLSKKGSKITKKFVGSCGC